MTKDDLEAIRQRDKKGFSEEGRTWDTKRITDTPAQMASDRHALLRYIDELRAAPEPSLAQPHVGTFVPAITSTGTVPLTHWSKDFLVPYIGCNCSTCVDARASGNRGAEHE